jgi:hypothetical protein
MLTKITVLTLILSSFSIVGQASSDIDLKDPKNANLVESLRVEQVLEEESGSLIVTVRNYKTDRVSEPNQPYNPYDLLITHYAVDGSFKKNYLVPANLIRMNSLKLVWSDSQGFGGLYAVVKGDRRTTPFGGDKVVKMEIRLTDATGEPLEEVQAEEAL